MPRATGIVARVVGERGFGFIRAGDGTMVFFHRSECRGCDLESLRPGQEVTFELQDGLKGPRGLDVRPSGGA